MSTNHIISKVWSFCNTLRDDGVSYGDYLEQLTYLLFLKMADEYAKPPYNRKLNIPTAYNWQSLTALKGAELEAHYNMLLRELGQQRGILGQIFTKSQNKTQDPAKLYKLIDMIDAREKCRRHQKRRRTILYAKSTHKGNGRMCASSTQENHCRPCMRYWRFFFSSV